MDYLEERAWGCLRVKERFRRSAACHFLWLDEDVWKHLALWGDRFLPVGDFSAQIAFREQAIAEYSAGEEDAREAQVVFFFCSGIGAYGEEVGGKVSSFAGIRPLRKIYGS